MRLPLALAAVLLAAPFSSFCLPVPGGLAAGGEEPSSPESAVEISRDGLDWPKAKESQLGMNLHHPTDILAAPDGSVWFTEVFEGNITRLDPATGNTRVLHRVDLWQDSNYSERGLAGIALDPDFANNRAYYAYYTHPDSSTAEGINRLVRIRDGNETILLDGIPAAAHHNGGKIAFAPDKTLFVSVGDNDLKDPAQDLDSPLGKVLHLTREGKPVADNLRGLVYSYGHRNIFGLAIDPATGDLYATENSGMRRDELNRVLPGRNYGYPACEGRVVREGDAPCPAGFEPPLLTFYEDRTAAPTGIVFWRGHMYWAAFNEGSIHHAWADAAGWHDEVVYDPPGDSPIADIEPTADGQGLYYSTWTSLWRLDVPLAAPPPRSPAPGPGSHILPRDPASVEENAVGASDKLNHSQANSTTSAGASRGSPGMGAITLLLGAGLAAMAWRRRGPSA